MLIPRELKVEQNKGVKAMSDAQLEAAKETLQRMLEPRAPGDEAKVIEMPVPVALPAPSPKPRRKRGAEAKPAPSL